MKPDGYKRCGGKCEGAVMGLALRVKTLGTAPTVSDEPVTSTWKPRLSAKWRNTK